MSDLKEICQTVKDGLQGLQSILTSAAIVVGAIWTYVLFVKKRQKYPRAKIVHQITHRPINTEKALLRVVIKIANEGEVLLPLGSGCVRIQKMAPWPTALLDAISQGKSAIKKGRTEIDWPLLHECKLVDHQTPIDGVGRNLVS